MFKSICTVGLCVVLLGGVVASGQDAADGPKSQTGQQLKVGPVKVEIDVNSIKLGEYWIGVECSPMTDDASEDPDSPRRRGIVVGNVVPDGPAAKAGIEPGDVILEAGKKPVAKIQDLIDAIEDVQQDELSLKIDRDGKVTKLTVTPAKRPRLHIGRHFVPIPGDPDSEQLKRWFGRVWPGADGSGADGPGANGPGANGPGSMQFRFIHPGTILPPGASVHPPLPKDMTVVITKTGSEPATVVIEQGDERWEVTEENLDDLPEKVRAHAERMLGRLPGSWIGKIPRPGDLRRFDLIPDWTVPKPRLKADSDSPAIVPGGIEERLEKRLEEMNRRMEELRKSMDQLRENRQKRKAADATKA